jgi:UDP-N-acetyl-D-mannosaminuronate dehydrogenase
MKQISILGCGWLGLPLAKALLQKGFSVHGSKTLN